MKLRILVLLLLFAGLAIAQDETLVVPKQCKPFQGTWRIVSMEDCEAKKEVDHDVDVQVKGEKFELKGNGVSASIPQPFEFRVPANKEDNPFRGLQEHGAEALSDIVDVENQIAVFWFIGIYRLKGDKLELALKYCGQGLEGIHFKNFRPPSSFDKKPMDGEIRVTLKRKKD
jgi:hypothetical protein